MATEIRMPLPWSGEAVQVLVSSAIAHGLIPMDISRIVSRAEEIARDYKAERVEQIVMVAAEEEIVHGNQIHTGKGECDRCLKWVPVGDLHALSADGLDWIACQSCIDAYDRYRSRNAD